MDKEKTLRTLRDEIDLIDSEIFNLLKRRLSVVKKVGQYKAGQGQGGESSRSIIRSGREAEMVRSFYGDAIKAGYDKKTAVGISYLWRIIISISVNLEQETKISLVSDEGLINGLVKQYFGFFSDIVDVKTNASALDCILNKDSTIAVIEASESDNYKNLEILMDEKYSRLKIFAALPFFERSENPKLFCVANLTPEQSGNDVFVYFDKGSGKLLKFNDASTDSSLSFLGCYAKGFKL